MSLCPSYHLRPGVPTVFVPHKKGLDSVSSTALQSSAEEVTRRQRKTLPLAEVDHMPSTPRSLRFWLGGFLRSEALYFLRDKVSHTAFQTKCLRTLPPPISTQLDFTSWKSLPFTLPKALWV